MDVVVLSVKNGNTDEVTINQASHVLYYHGILSVKQEWNATLTWCFIGLLIKETGACCVCTVGVTSSSF